MPRRRCATWAPTTRRPGCGPGLGVRRPRRRRPSPASRTTKRCSTRRGCSRRSRRACSRCTSTRLWGSAGPATTGSPTRGRCAPSRASRAGTCSCTRSGPKPSCPVPSARGWRCMGARLPPGASKAAERAGVVRHLWSVVEPDKLRGESISIGEGFAVRAEAFRRHRLAAPWNPLRALGPRLHPIVHVADEAARVPGAGRGAASCFPRTARAARDPPSASALEPARSRRSWGPSTTPSASGWCCRRTTACRRSSTRSKRPDADAARARRLLGRAARGGPAPRPPTSRRWSARAC